MVLSIEQRAMLAVGELKQIQISLEVQHNRAEELAKALKSRLEATKTRIEEIER